MNTEKRVSIKNIIVILLVTFLNIGCATNRVPISKNTIASLNGASVVKVSSYDRNPFAIVYSKSLQFSGGYGEKKAYERGGEVFSKYNLTHAKEILRNKIADRLSTKYNTQTEISPVIIHDSIYAKIVSGLDLIKHLSSAKYAVYVDEISFFADTIPFSSLYEVHFSALAELINLETGEFEARAACDGDHQKMPNAPTYDQMLENNAERLKSMIEFEVEQCFKHMIENDFKI